MANQLFKDRLARPEVERIADALARVDPTFPCLEFVRLATDGLSLLELKDRVRHIIEALRSYLPADFSDAAEILYELLDVFDRGDPDDPFRGFAAWPLIDCY